MIAAACSALAENDLGESLPDRPVQVELCPADVVVREAAEFFEGVFHRDFTGLYPFQNVHRFASR